MSSRLVLKVTAGADDAERCNQAFTVAATAAASGVDVSLWLTGEAAWFGLPGRAATFVLPKSTALTELLSTVLESTSATAGLGIAVFLVLATFSAWGPAARWSPAGLVPAPSTLAMNMETVWAWPIGTAVVTAALCVLAACLAMRRREL